MSGVGRRFVNLGVLDNVKRLYSLRRLDLSKVDLFHRTPQDAKKALPVQTLAKVMLPNRRRICKTDLATAETAAPKIGPLAPLVAARTPVCSTLVPCNHGVHFFPTASEKKVILLDRADRVISFDADDSRRCILSMPSLHAPKNTPLGISLPPTTKQLRDDQDAGELYIMDRILWPSIERPQFEALVWSLRDPSLCERSWNWEPLPLPPFIAHQKHVFVVSYAVVGGDTICYSIDGRLEGSGTYCFHTATREWSKAGDWLMPFAGKAEYDPELRLWLGFFRGLPCAMDLSGVVRGEEPPSEKLRIWADDDLPKQWVPDTRRRSKLVSLGSGGKLVVVDFFQTMVFDKECNEMICKKQFALFTGMELIYGKVKGKGMRGLRMMKHKSCRYMINLKHMIEAVI